METVWVEKAFLRTAFSPWWIIITLSPPTSLAEGPACAPAGAAYRRPLIVLLLADGGVCRCRGDDRHGNAGGGAGREAAGALGARPGAWAAQRAGVICRPGGGQQARQSRCAV